jgi:hypothetical protein
MHHGTALAQHTGSFHEQSLAAGSAESTVSPRQSANATENSENFPPSLILSAGPFSSQFTLANSWNHGIP